MIEKDLLILLANIRSFLYQSIHAKDGLIIIISPLRGLICALFGSIIITSLRD